MATNRRADFFIALFFVDGFAVYGGILLLTVTLAACLGTAYCQHGNGDGVDDAEEEHTDQHGGGGQIRADGKDQTKIGSQHGGDKVQGGLQPAVHASDIKNTVGGTDGQREGEEKKDARGGERQRAFGIGAVDQKDQQTVDYDHGRKETAGRIEGVFEHGHAPFVVIYIMYHKSVLFSMG